MSRSRINRGHLKAHWLTLRMEYVKLINEGKIEVEFRHVKAHSGKNDARSFVNEWCDRTAKHYLRKRIELAKKQIR